MSKKLLFLMLFGLSFALHAESPLVEKLIAKLAESEDMGLGYSSSVSGSQFLPLDGSSEWSMALLGEKPLVSSMIMKSIVEEGSVAIPFLVTHLDDPTPTRIKPVSGIMWMGWNDEYDFNRRTTLEIPKGVNRNTFGEHFHPHEHKITVGDLCFVALGQIVNRRFSAIRYQPTGGLIVNSPTYSKSLLAVIRQEYGKFSYQNHLEQLLDDLIRPDSSNRRNGALIRLAYYYPEEVEAISIQILRMPYYDDDKVEDFITKKLYRTKSVNRRNTLLNKYVAKHGPPAREGVIVTLFNHLDSQIAIDEGRINADYMPNCDARNCLQQIFGFKKNVLPCDRPIIKSLSYYEASSFIETLSIINTASPSIIKEIKRIYTSVNNEDRITEACAEVLNGKEISQKRRN